MATFSGVKKQIVLAVLLTDSQCLKITRQCLISSNIKINGELFVYLDNNLAAFYLKIEQKQFYNIAKISIKKLR